MTKHCDGFTLIELLVSLLIFGILLASVATLLSFFFQQMGKTRYEYARRSQSFYWLNSAVGGMFFYTMSHEEIQYAGQPKYTYFFTGGQDSMEFITSSPVTFEGIALERLYVEDGKLYLNETPVYSRVNDFLEPRETEETQRIVLHEKVSKLGMTYVRRIDPTEGYDEEMGQILGVPDMGAKTSEPVVEEVGVLKDDVPEQVRLRLVLKDGSEREWHFRVKAGFRNKKGYTARMCDEF